ncbi:MAG: hypothetical protein ABIA04_14360 [Pseudomonadota bacterium]
MDAKRKRLYLIGGGLLLLIVIANNSSKEDKASDEVSNIPKEETYELNLKIPEAVDQGYDDEYYEDENTDKDTIVSPRLQKCNDLWSYACNIEDEDLLDDHSGFYNSKTGFSNVGIVKKQTMAVSKFIDNFWNLYSEFQVEGKECKTLVDKFKARFEEMDVDNCKTDKKKCMGDKNCELSVHYYCYYLAERAYIRGFDKVPDWEVYEYNALKACRKQVYLSIYDKYYRYKENEVSRLYKKAMRYAITVIERELPGSSADFRSLILSTDLLLGDILDHPDFYGANEGLMFDRIIFRMDNAYFAESHRYNYVSIGLSVINRFWSKMAILYILGHEMGHNFDPMVHAIDLCGFGNKSKKQADDNKRMEGKYYPNPITCASVPSELKAKSKELIKVIDLASYAKVKKGETHNYSYLGELFADWFGIMILNEYFKDNSVSLEDRRRAMLNISRLICDNDAKKEGDVHPKWQDRVNKLMRKYLERPDELYMCIK